MSVGSYKFPEMKPISGVSLGTACAGIKQTDRDDLLLIELIEGSSCAAVFTQNAFCAAPVILARRNLENSPRWLIINSGNANAGTGEQGLAAAQAVCNSLADIVDGGINQVMPFSTGVIGEQLPIIKIKSAMPAVVKDLSQDHWDKAARAIMTTDTFAKGSSKVVEIEGKPVNITGISKGAGMIQPNMATMLAFIATDANIEQIHLQECLSKAVESSFNRITIDGDTSTNDACVLMATGCSDAKKIEVGSQYFHEFSTALQDVCQELAEAIVRDGEGATKLMRIIVEQAKDPEEAVRVGKTIAHSPLVKTAFFASDPNWGRVLAAVGRSGVEAMEINAIEIYFDEVCIVKNGGRADSYTEDAGRRVMAKDEIDIRVVLGRGYAREQILTCDLSYEYVRINAEYRT